MMIDVVMLNFDLIIELLILVWEKVFSFFFFLSKCISYHRIKQSMTDLVKRDRLMCTRYES